MVDAQTNWRYRLTDTATGREVSLAEVLPTYGLPGMDITGPIRSADGTVVKGGLRVAFGAEAYDPGYRNTASAASPITFIDGDEGILLHRGYNIKDLVPNCDHMELTCLLREGELPNPQRLDAFRAEMAANAAVPDYVYDVIEKMPKGAKPMAVLAAAVNALAATRTEDKTGHHVIAQMPTLVAAVIRKDSGLDGFIRPDPARPYSENFLHMVHGYGDDMFGASEPNPASVAAVDKLLMLHADHEQNCGTATVRVARSSLAGPYEAIAAGVNALSGPRHGGANEKVMEMLDALVAEQERDGLTDDEVIDRLIARVKDKKDMLWGFGHAVYTNVDPRATVLKGFVDELLSSSGKTDQRFVLAQKIEARARANPYFINDKKPLNPNVDFYSGVAMTALGIERRHFTLMFALGRTAGWVAQAEEVIAQNQQIYRPRQAYVGPAERPVVPITLRIGANGGPAIDEPAPAMV